MSTKRDVKCLHRSSYWRAHIDNKKLRNGSDHAKNGRQKVRGNFKEKVPP